MLRHLWDSIANDQIGSVGCEWGFNARLKQSDGDLWADEVHARLYSMVSWHFALFSMIGVVEVEIAQICVVLHTSAVIVRRFVFLCDSRSYYSHRTLVDNV